MHDRFLPARPSAERLDTVEQELQDFSYMVSHDLAASFRHLSAFSRLLLDEFEQTLTSRQRAYAEHLQLANTRCQLMMEQLLVFSRAQQRVLAPIQQDATLAMGLAMLKLVRDGQPLDAEVVSEPLGFVYADPDLLGLVFRHLVSNALKFRRPDAPARIEVSGDSDRSAWRLRVRDNGIGVETKHREKAFRMFQRLNGDAFAGVGAGLALCRRVAHRHGGDVEFIDCETGACVELWLPHAPRMQ